MEKPVEQMMTQELENEAEETMTFTEKLLARDYRRREINREYLKRLASTKE